ncbi:MAG TPA: acyltransferase [Anaerolineales bacterium]|nr:acyltransferase [Anaerolineales bacterium]
MFLNLYFNRNYMIPGLDGLRAIAFLLIFWLHIGYLQIGWIGVQFFFVLSGFLITGILLNMKRSLRAGEYFSKFYGRRFLRIFPLYYFYLLLMTGVAVFLISIPYKPNYMKIFLDQVWYAVFYLYDFFFGTIFFQSSHFLDHFWSLSVEEQFYIVWPLLIFLAPEKHLKKLFLTFIFLGPLFRLTFHFIYFSGVFRFLARNVELALYPLPFSHVDAFAFGAYLSRYSIPKAKQQFFFLLVAIPLIGSAAHYLATGELGSLSALGYPLLMPNAYQYIWGYSLLNYFFALTIQVVVREKLFLRFLEWSPMQYLGKISYGLYVYHFPIIWFAGRLFGVNPLDLSLPPHSATIAFAATLLIASLSYHFIEKPILNLKDRFFPLIPNQHDDREIPQETQSASHA